jgi:hypothetical protein
MNVSPCGFKVKEFALKFAKEPDCQLTTCSTCTVEGKCGRKMGSTLGPNRGPRARVLLTHLNSFPFLPLDGFQLNSHLFESI